MAITTLYRPVGPVDLRIIEEAGWRAFPTTTTRTADLHPVLNEEYAVQIAQRWNVRESGSGYVTALDVDTEYLVGVIRVIRRFDGNGVSRAGVP